MPVSRILPPLILVASLVPMSPAQAADGDLFARGVEWCASTHPNHGTLKGFGEPIDINRREGSDAGMPLYAPGRGRVRIHSTGWGGGWGNSVVWTSRDGREQIHLAHLSAFDRTGRVRAGDRIGRIGSTGRSSGPHLHTSRRFAGEPAPLVLMGKRIRPGRCYASTGPVPRYCQGRLATIVGTRGDDVLRGTSGRDVIVGLGGDDVLIGKGGNDLLCGGRGADVLRGGAGRDRLFGNAGDNRLLGGPGADLLDGGRGFDVLRGGRGRDRCRNGQRLHSCELPRPEPEPDPEPDPDSELPEVP